MRPLVFALLVLFAAGGPLLAHISVARSQTRPATLDVAIVREPLSFAVHALEFYLRKPVELASSFDPLVSFSAHGVRPEAALSALALSGGARLSERRHKLVIETAGPVVTLDVKDEEVHVILRSLKQQCGIRNLIVDPGVSGNGTFLLRDVPCRTAFNVVFGMMGLRATYEPNSVVTVSIRR
ncbi:MAG: hypothetical protein ABIP63_10510 [Thermoanaerobaculia bacterium]